MLNAGDLDRRIQLQSSTKTPDAFNEATDTWSDVAKVWAAKDDVSDGERTRAAEKSAVIDTRFRIRWRADLAAFSQAWRVLYGGRTYHVLAVKEIGRREGLELSTGARLETTP